MSKTYKIDLDVEINDGELGTEREVENWLSDLIRYTYIAQVTGITATKEE